MLEPMTKSSDLKKRLLINAIDFLSVSIKSLADRPKHSVISFYTAVELFLKARLLDEHWSLVVSRKQEPDWDKFVSGDFQSVTLDEACRALQKVAGSGLTDKELRAFREVRNDRNKMVHFFHEADSDEDGRRLREDIAKKQLIAWYLLHKIIQGRWSAAFSAWSDEIDAIDRQLREHHQFLEVVYDHVKPAIDERKAEGFIYLGCPSCVFESSEHEGEAGTVYTSSCAVCGLEETCVRIECRECSEEIVLRNEGFSECEDCGVRIEPETLYDCLVDNAAAHIAAKDGDDSWYPGNCSNCEGFHTVVRLQGDTYFCTQCFLQVDYLSVCGWCNEPNTGDMEDSFLMGCSVCDGRLGWEKDD